MTDDDTPPAGPPRWSSVDLTAEAMKVLAHPLRARLLSALRTDGSATATTLAERLGTNTGATSYHLRRLASVGLVEETGTGRGRERWWRPTTEMHGWSDDSVGEDRDAAAAARWLREHYLRTFVERAERWAVHSQSWPPAWRRAAGSSDMVLRLTAEQLDALQRDLWAVITRHRDAADDAAGDAADDAAGDADDAATSADGEVGDDAARRRVLLFLHAFPEGEAPR
jgi:predicted ArsR family transcriptional regulator